MDIVIRNATIIPLTSADACFLGDIAISEGKIVSVGSVPCGFNPYKTIDATGKLAMPGLVNAHTHASMVFFRNFKDAVENLQDWLGEIWPLEDLLKPEDILPASRLAIAEMIHSGITCFADMYFFPEATCQAVVESGIKANIGLTLFGDFAESRRRMETRQPLVDPFVQMATSDRIRFDVAPHAIYTCTRETLSYAKDLVRERSCRIHIHLSETSQEVQDCIDTHGTSPVEYLDSVGLLGDRTYIAHMVHPVGDDLRRISDNGASVIHNPSSNCKLGSGIAPVSRMHREQIRCALGTDGAASNNTLDLFQEMRLAAMLGAVSTGNPVAITPFEILRMATLGGAAALGRENSCGTLETGKDADLILINLDGPHMQPLNNPFSALVFGAKSSDVDTVVCQGKILMEHRKLTTIDLTSTVEEVNARWRDIPLRTRRP